MGTEPIPPPAVLRGSIWWIDFEPAGGAGTQKARPAVVISLSVVSRARRTVVVVPLSTGPARYPPFVVPVPSAGPGAMAITDQVRAVNKFRLQRPCGELSPSDLRAVENGVRAVLGLA